jgi:hypothetical protein
VLELLDPAAKTASLLLDRIEVLRQLHQALVRHDPLDTGDAGIQVIQFDLDRIVLRPR